MGTGQETTQYDFGCTCLWQCTQRHVTITPTSPKEPRLGYTLLHTWQKKLSISKFHKNSSNICKMRKKSTTINTRTIVRMSQRTMDKTDELYLQDEEEEYDNKYTDYCENVTTNDGQDGRALLA